MFKRAVITDEISQDIRRAADVMCEYGMDGAELRSVWGKAPQDLSDSELREIKAVLDAKDLLVPCIAAPVFKCKLHSQSEFEAHLAILKRCMEMADLFGAKLIRGFTFWAEGEFSYSVPTIVEKLKEAEKLLSKKDMQLVIEYDPATSAGTTQKLEVILKKVASEHIQALFDPGNNIYDPEGERPFPDGYERIKPWMKHIHVKDVNRREAGLEPESVLLGEGEVNFPDLFERLVDDGYEGWTSLETHYRKAAAISTELLHRPMGYSFSEGGEEASRECLDAWNRMLAERGLIP